MDSIDYRGIIKNVRDYILQQINEDRRGIPTSINDVLSINSLSIKFGISRTNLKKFFSAYTDTHETVHKYIMRHKLQRALALIREGKHTMDDISFIVGFANQPALNNSIRKLRKMSPSEAREYMLSDVPEEYPYKIDNPVLVHLPHMLFLTMPMETGYDVDDSVWDKLFYHAKSKNLLMNGDQEYWGMTFDDADVADDDRKMFCACLPVNDVPFKDEKGFGRQNVSEGSYAVFTHRGSYDLLDSFYDAALNMLPTGCLVDRPFLEKYVLWDTDDTSQLVTEVYIPVNDGIKIG